MATVYVMFYLLHCPMKVKHVKYRFIHTADELWVALQTSHAKQIVILASREPAVFTTNTTTVILSVENCCDKRLLCAQHAKIPELKPPEL